MINITVILLTFSNSRGGLESQAYYIIRKTACGKRSQGIRMIESKKEEEKEKVDNSP